MSPLKEFPELTDVSKPLELTHGEVIYFKAANETHTKFYFDVKEPYVVKLDVWPLDAKSDPDLYVKIDDESVDEKNNDFRQNKIGSNQLMVSPDSLKFKKGRYWVSVHAF